MSHTEECSTRVAEELEKVGAKRLEREKERLFEHLEREANRQKRAKASEDSGDTKVGVSSSGPSTSEGAIPTNRG